jgi:hypothetical protein
MSLRPPATNGFKANNYIIKESGVVPLVAELGGLMSDFPELIPRFSLAQQAQGGPQGYLDLRAVRGSVGWCLSSGGKWLALMSSEFSINR